MDKNIVTMPMSGFCAFGPNGHEYCQKPDCPCDCHKEKK